MQRPPPRLNATETIQNYRKRRGRTMPVIFSGLAVVLLVGGVVALVSWLAGETAPAFLVSPTPTVTSTPTPNPPTPTPVPTGTPTEVPTATLTPTPVRPFTYTVEQGDTLIALAERFELDVLVLMAANAIVDPGSLFVGQELVIPPLDARLPTPTPIPPNLRPGTLIPYFVQFGDTLELIAAKFNSTAAAIAEENDIENANEIAVGQVLQIPVNLVTPTPSPSPGTPIPSGTATPTP